MTKHLMAEFLESVALEAETKKPALQRFKRHKTTEDEIKKWKEQRPTLGRVKIGKEFKGILLSDNDQFVAVLQCNIVTGYIVAIEVSQHYRSQGIAVELLDAAIKEFHCKKLTVRETNTAAINLYKTHGWRVFKKEGIMLFMRHS